jgi:hypothetical protein
MSKLANGVQFVNELICLFVDGEMNEQNRELAARYRVEQMFRIWPCVGAYASSVSRQREN